MSTPANIARIAALVGDPGRAAMLDALVRTESLTAGELATHAGVTAATASGHLAQLAVNGLLAVTKVGRERRYRLASPEVARMLEAIMVVAATPGQDRPARARRIPPDLQTARSCYDHLAGKLGVAIAEGLAEKGLIHLSLDSGEVTEAGRAFLDKMGVDLSPLANGRRLICRPCLDWSERRPHIAGVLGAALLVRALDQAWVRRGHGRAISVTPTGQRIFREAFGVRLS